MVKYEWCVLAKALANIFLEILVPGYIRESEESCQNHIETCHEQVWTTNTKTSSVKANNHRQDLVQIACF